MHCKFINVLGILRSNILGKVTVAPQLDFGRLGYSTTLHSKLANGISNVDVVSVTAKLPSALHAVEYFV